MYPTPSFNEDQISQIPALQLEKRVRPCLHVPVDKEITVVVQNTDVHGAGMQVDAAVELAR